MQLTFYVNSEIGTQRLHLRVILWNSCLLLMPLNWEGQEVTEVWRNQLCPATGRLKPACSAAVLFGAQQSQYGVWAVLNFRIGLWLSVWVTATWRLCCFCIHLMHKMFFQFLLWWSQRAIKCGLDMRSMQGTEIGWQKSTAVMLLKVLILFLLLVMFIWELWSQFCAIYLGIQKKATNLFSELPCGKSTVPHAFLFPCKHLAWARLNAIQVGCTRHPEPGKSSGSDQHHSITQILLLVLKYRVIGLSW